MPLFKVRTILVHDEFVVEEATKEDAIDRVIWNDLPYMEWEFEAEEIKETEEGEQ